MPDDYDELEARVLELNAQHENSTSVDERKAIAAKRYALQERQRELALEQGGYGQILNLGGSGPDEIGHRRQDGAEDPRAGSVTTRGDGVVVAYTAEEA